MTTPSSIALAGFVTWALLVVLMELVRTRLVLTGRVSPAGFVPDNANLSPFMQRLARAYANCVENIPILGGLLLVAIVTGRAPVTDPLACVLLGARVVQSSIHLVSVSPPMVTARFAAFAVQLGIGLYWAWKLLFTAGA
ncbi:MAPEG family protein [Ottowia sp.]|uniref:MAPEG family protein n=1 Tax=Ottowia sp. TaxID=1898956 RepID=UPI002C102865|nr:MAPEG family protein [Ottowia sp.]HRN76213.1 MAPEG family protein [Ottowia sp.]HRQ02259.1 MAPEG family protein [Ottowia sp.]